MQMSDRWVEKSRCSSAFALVFAPSWSSSTPEEEEKVAKNEDLDRSTFPIKQPFKMCISLWLVTDVFDLKHIFN